MRRLITTILQLLVDAERPRSPARRERSQARTDLAQPHS
jgi:hypothetical protein